MFLSLYKDEVQTETGYFNDREYFSRNQDSGKVFFLEKQEYVHSCETHDI